VQKFTPGSALAPHREHIGIRHLLEITRPRARARTTDRIPRYYSKVSEKPPRRKAVGPSTSLKLADGKTHLISRGEARFPPGSKGGWMLLLLLLLLVLIAVVPAWPYSRGWGYYPSGGLGLVLMIVLIFFLLGYF
jgi:hypothetical protein